MARLLAAIAALFVSSLPAFAQTLSSGTGFVFTPNGHIATNFHVIAGAASIGIRNAKGDITQAEVIALDRANDLAILQVKGRDFAYLPIRSSTSVRKGESVYTLGFPNIQMQGLEAKVTDGIISSLSGVLGEPNTFQISVPIQPGNSGGPLFDKAGSVVGLVVAKLSAIASVKAGVGLPENVNYAIKSNYLLELARSNRNVAPIAPPRKVKYTNFVDVIDEVERATVLVIASGENTKQPGGSDAVQHSRPNSAIGPDRDSSGQINACSSSSQCSPNGQCVSGKCRPFASSLEGQQCIESFECIGALRCINGLCASPSNTRQPVPGSRSSYLSCQRNIDCAQRGELCFSGKCFRPESKGIGESCWATAECVGDVVTCEGGRCSLSR